MWISYSDSEVKRFHPICGRALKLALVLIGKEKEYAVLHHKSAGSLEMDYVVQNKATGKYLCVVEVKRTPCDVHSARYQFQAMSYVQMNAGQVEQPFYILTNLEYAYAFRYEAGRPRVFKQILEPGLCKIGNFSKDKEEEFVKKLSLYFKANLINFIENKYRYLLTLEEFSNFYQLICEVLSKDQEGMRKMEVRDIADSWIPDLGSVLQGAQVALTHEIRSFSFLNLRHPEIRNIDLIWANELFGEDSEHMLYTSKRMLELLVARWNP